MIMILLYPKVKRVRMIRSQFSDLIEEILTSRYRFFEEIQSLKSFKDYKYFNYKTWYYSLKHEIVEI